MTSVLGIFGVGGFGREVMPLAKKMKRSNECYKDLEIVFVDTSASKNIIGEAQIESEDDFFDRSNQERFFTIAISDARKRREIHENCVTNGCTPMSIISPNADIIGEPIVGSGAIICGFVSITDNVRIGLSFHANIYSYIAHDCVIGDFVTFAPSVKCNGNVKIEDFAYIGTGAILKQGSPEKPLIIGEGAIVGMGAVVTKDVAPYTTVVGNPARILARS